MHACGEWYMGVHGAVVCVRESWLAADVPPTMRAVRSWWMTSEGMRLQSDAGYRHLKPAAKCEPTVKLCVHAYWSLLRTALDLFRNDCQDVVIMRMKHKKSEFLLTDEDYGLRITDYALQISRTKSKTRKSIENV